MKFNTCIPKTLKPYFDLEIARSKAAFRNGELAPAWHHLERAHILGQAYPYEHSYAHWEMLKFGFRIKSGKEIRGQILRLLFGGVKSFVGTVPVGNTGGANVHPLATMEIPPELKTILSGHKSE